MTLIVKGLLFAIALALLLGSLLWYRKKRSWEPRLAILGAIASLITLTYDSCNIQEEIRPDSRSVSIDIDNTGGTVIGYVEEQYNYYNSPDTPLNRKDWELERKIDELEQKTRVAEKPVNIKSLNKTYTFNESYKIPTELKNAIALIPNLNQKTIQGECDFEIKFGYSPSFSPIVGTTDRFNFVNGYVILYINDKDYKLIHMRLDSFQSVVGNMKNNLIPLIESDLKNKIKLEKNIQLIVDVVKNHI